jgi:hypothetical protein
LIARDIVKRDPRNWQSPDPVRGDRGGDKQKSCSSVSITTRGKPRKGGKQSKKQKQKGKTSTINQGNGIQKKQDGSSSFSPSKAALVKA